MHASSGNPLTTLLMMLPLIAVPAFAILGVPGVDSLNGSVETAPADSDAVGDGSADSDSDSDAIAASSLGPSKPAHPTDDDLGDGFLNLGANDPFLSEKAGSTRGSSRDPDRVAQADADGTGSDRTRPRSPRSRANVPSGKRARGASADIADSADDEMPFGEPPDQPDSAFGSSRGGPADRSDPTRGATGAASGDLKSAAARLRTLGIRDFQLSPGDDGRSFVFACRHVSPQNPRVVRRFEAEAADPQAAVEEVLSQVESWVSER